MSKTASGIPEIYNIKKSLQMELEYLKKKVTRQCGTCQIKLKELEIRTNWYELILIV